MRIITCSGGQEIEIDDEDFHLVSQYNWYLARSKQGLYYARTTSRKKIYLHRLVTNASKGQIVDHIDNNTLNCQKANLRFVSSQQNSTNKKVSSRNKLGVKGVSFDKAWNRYVAQLTNNGIHYRRWFDTVEEASNQYREWSVMIHKEYGNS